MLYGEAGEEPGCLVWDARGWLCFDVVTMAVAPWTQRPSCAAGYLIRQVLLYPPDSPPLCKCSVDWAEAEPMAN